MSLKPDKRCEMCGGVLELDADGRHGKCAYCGSTYTYVKPVTADSVTSINRANNYRLKNMFDNAIVEYKTLLQNEEFADNSEVWWGLLLAEYGIEYVHDARSDVYVPTCHRTIGTSILASEAYRKAIEYAPADMRAFYERLAAEIDELQTAIKIQAELIDDYEVFISFKSTDNRAATEDRYIARKIYDELTKRGFRTFFSEVSLKGRLGGAYEPVIYKALTTARVMILVCTDEQYLEAPFVRNEWSRFLERKKDNPELSLIPVFRNVDYRLLPTKEQGVDLSKYPAGGYEVDIADNLESRLGKRAVPKIDKDILAEYSHYNEISKIKYDKEFTYALRDVDLSDKRAKNAGKEFLDKAEEMERLGDFKNAPVLAADYRAKATHYANEENRTAKKMRIWGIAGICLSLGQIALTILATYIVTCYSDFRPDSSFIWIFGNIATIAAAGCCFIAAIVYLFVIPGSRYKSAAKKTEIIIYSTCLVLPATVCLMNIGTSAPLVYFPVVILAAAQLFFAYCKYRHGNKLRICE